MFRNTGFSLIELIIVIAIIGILSGLSMLAFNQWTRKANIERYTKEIYADLQDIRSKSIFTKQRHSVDINTNNLSFRRYSTLNDSNGTLLTNKQVPFILQKSTWSNPSATRIVFDTNGIMTDQTTKYICIENTAGASVDAIAITPVLTTIASKSNTGGNCEEANIKTK
jgi:prepilin-type N-terminal cleavage/methylation domain-containing protein